MATDFPALKPDERMRHKREGKPEVDHRSKCYEHIVEEPGLATHIEGQIRVVPVRIVTRSIRLVHKKSDAKFHEHSKKDGADERDGYGLLPRAKLSDQKRGASPFLKAWGQAAHRRQAIAICKRYNARMKYKSNNNVVYSCKYHVVFCPKYRRPVLVDGVDERFKQIAQQVADGLHFEIIEMEVMPDHVHMLLEVDPQLGIHKAVKRIKGRTSHDLREEFPWLMKRLPTLWTNSYFVSTVGGAPLAIVKQYIENQKGV